MSVCVILINSLVDAQVFKAASTHGLFAVGDSFLFVVYRTIVVISTPNISRN